MRIGFDISMTHQQKAGCAYFADKLSNALIREYPQNNYFLYDHYITPNNCGVIDSESLIQDNVFYPLRGLTISEALNYWNEVARTDYCKPIVDVIHSNNFQSCKLSSVKLVYTIYDVSFWTHPEYTTEANRLNCQQGILDALNNADGFVYISSHARDELHSTFPGLIERRGIKECIVHPGPSHVLTSLESSSDTSQYWLQVGSLEPRKNHTTALDAHEIYWKHSLRKMPLKIAGGNGWKSDSLLRRITALEEKGMVIYLGYVPDDDMKPLYGGAISLIFPSWYEGFGLPILEAMGIGCPVICSSTSSMPEVGGDAVCYIDPTNPHQIAAEMLRIEGDPMIRETMVLKGKKQALQFSWSKAAKQLNEFYKQIIS